MTTQFDVIVTSPLTPQTGRGSCRTFLYSELYNTNRGAKADDDVEGALHYTCLFPQQHVELTRDLAESFNRTYSSPTPMFHMLSASKYLILWHPNASSLSEVPRRMSKSAISTSMKSTKNTKNVNTAFA